MKRGDADQSPTVDQLRDDIDRGRTGDKVEGGDPAAAPLGTDDEAAGTPVSPSRVTLARSLERTATPHPPQDRRGPGHAWILIALILVLMTAIAFWGFWIRSSP